MKKLIVLNLILFVGNCLCCFSQQIDLNNPTEMIAKDKWLKINGGLNANTILYSGNEPYTRKPFTYNLAGNINFNILGQVNLPFSFNFTNSGSNYTYPTMPNRFAIHPTYKWITGHFGDVAMNYSPYTLNGHLFTGAGLDLNLDGPFKASVMYGRLQRSVEYDPENANVMAAYKRMGSGFKLRFEKPKYQFGMTFLAARDYENSLQWKPDSLMIFPQENMAGSFNAGVQLLDALILRAEYGISVLNRDKRMADKDLAESNYHAYKVTLDYTFRSNTIGIGYERIDPGYKTLGAYYFNNDLENITLSYARPFLKNKGSISLNGGIEHDDLKNEKESKTRRFVLAANVSYTPSEKLNMAFSYSTFQTYMNIKSQFDYINEVTPYDNLDTLDYTQLSQNINLGMNYLISRDESKSHSLDLNLSYQEAADKQGDIVQEGASSLFYNASLGYGLQFIPQQINVNCNLNFTSNRVDEQDLFIFGPTLGVTSKFLERKLSLGLVGSYNSSFQEGDSQGEVWLLRWNASYLLLKKHNFLISAVFRDNKTNTNPLTPQRTNGFTFTAGYNYRF